MSEEDARHFLLHNLYTAIIFNIKLEVRKTGVTIKCKHIIQSILTKCTANISLTECPVAITSVYNMF